MGKTIFITGATGVMGKASLDAILKRGDCRVRLLVRPGKKNDRLMSPYRNRKDVDIIWGDLLDPEKVDEALGDADIVLHMGGMVSPAADRFPDKTLKVNVGGTQNVVNAIKSRKNSDDIKLVYIGSVAQTSLRQEPYHWGRTGDPVLCAEFDYYGLSKIKAERLVAESGLKYWVSLRQSGILHPGLFLRGSDPITFHVPLRGVLEWTTLEDSARLMAALCDEGVPDSFWCNFYNIGSGEEYRLSNYEFEQKILGAIGSPKPEKIFETNWFATRNFHGCWFIDSDRLEEIVPFRAHVPIDTYFKNMKRRAPWWVKLAPLAPAFLVKQMMRKVAQTKDYGTLDWINRRDCEDKIKAFWGSREERESLPGWETFNLTRPSEHPVVLEHGYDETKKDEELALDDFQKAAHFRGGKCLSEAVEKGDIHTPLKWECAFGHRFEAKPSTILKGGHWCPECESGAGNREAEAKHNRFLSQLLNS